MALRVNVCHVEVLDNPSTFFAPFRIEITFEVFENLPKDLEWKLVYVTDTEEHDQELDSVMVGPVPEGRHKFIFEADAPNPEKIPQSEILGVNVLLLYCAYDDKRFMKIGWFVSNEYLDAELRENPPTKPMLDQLTRRVLNDDVRVTSYPIKWDDSEEAVVVKQDASAASPSEQDVQSMDVGAASSNANSETIADDDMAMADATWAQLDKIHMTTTEMSASACQPLGDVTNGETTSLPTHAPT